MLYYAIVLHTIIIMKCTGEHIVRKVARAETCGCVCMRVPVTDKHTSYLREQLGCTPFLN